MANILKCSKNYFQGVTTKLLIHICDIRCHAFRARVRNLFVGRPGTGRSHDMAQTMRHLAVMKDFVPPEWHDLTRHVAEHCGNKLLATMMLTKPRNVCCIGGRTDYRHYHLYRASQKRSPKLFLQYFRVRWAFVYLIFSCCPTISPNTY